MATTEAVRDHCDTIVQLYRLFWGQHTFLRLQRRIDWLVVVNDNWILLLTGEAHRSSAAHDRQVSQRAVGIQCLLCRLHDPRLKLPRRN